MYCNAEKFRNTVGREDERIKEKGKANGYLHGKKFKPKEEWVITKNTHEPLITEDIAYIIKEIKKDGIVSYNDLLASLKYQTSDSVKNVFHYSLSFLYLMDTMEYIPELDALRLKQ